MSSAVAQSVQFRDLSESEIDSVLGSGTYGNAIGQMVGGVFLHLTGAAAGLAIGIAIGSIFGAGGAAIGGFIGRAIGRQYGMLTGAALGGVIGSKIEDAIFGPSY